MAKITPPQEIPSELLDGYRATLGEKRPDNGVRKRVPYRIPTIQTLVGHPSPKQKAQRARFLVAENDFAGVDWPARQRWYDAAPVWGSFLWYYNYFIMSSLAGNANPPAGGSGVIKSIQHVSASCPESGAVTININEVDPAKSVVMIQGASHERHVINGEIAWVVYPYLVWLHTTQVRIGWATSTDVAGMVSADIIEYI